MIPRDIRLPEWGVVGQGFRFALSGTLVAFVYLTSTTSLHSVLAVPFQIALAIGFASAMAVHFTLQRLFVWRHPGKFALSAHRQAARYLLVAGAQYGITALSTARLPDLLGVPVEVVYVTTTLVVAAINFVIFRRGVFHAGAADTPAVVHSPSDHVIASGYLLAPEQSLQEPPSEGACARTGGV